MTHLGGECVAFTVAGWMYIHPHLHPFVCTYVYVCAAMRESLAVCRQWEKEKVGFMEAMKQICGKMQPQEIYCLCIAICTYICVWCNERELSCVLNNLCSLHVHTVHCSLSTYVHPVCIVTLAVLPCSTPHNVYLCILSVYVPT